VSVRAAALVALLLSALLAAAACVSLWPTPVPTSGPEISLREVAARAAHTATTLTDGSIFVAGGCVVDGCGRATAFTFLVSADGTATNGPQMAHARDSHTATQVGTAVVIAGGFSGEGQPPLDSVEILRSPSGPLEVSAPLVQGRGGHAAATLGDGRVLVVGGWIRPRTYTASVEIVDPRTGDVVAADDLPYAADALDAVALADGRVLVSGGQVRPAVGTDAAALYDGTTGLWQLVGPMNSRRFKHTTVLLKDGRVFVIGGTTDDEQLLATTEVFDPQTLTFSPGPKLLEPRYKMTGGAIAVEGQRVLIAGGGRTVELLDLEAGTSRVIDTLSGRGSFATINALAGSWLVLGGYDDQITLRRQFLLIGPEDLEAVGG
jgi:hypothetical protein